MMKRYWTNGHAPLHPGAGQYAVRVDGCEEMAEPGAPAEAAARAHSETMLQAARRLDWRFLLSDPTLERVAYFGPARSTLVTSLELFSHKLTLFPSTQVGSYHRAQYDVVVASEPGYGVLEQAVGLVRPGGSLYIEAHGLFWLGRWQRMGIASLVQSPRLWHPHDYMAAVERLGLAQTQAFWFWPNFEGCTKIIPLDDPVVLRHALATQSADVGMKARLRATYMRWLLQSKWLDVTLPCFGIVAH